MPDVLNKHASGVPVGAVYIGRPSIWGNPFAIGRDGSRDEVIEKYRTLLTVRPDLIAKARTDLRGRDLVCFCAPQACHGDVLLEIANAPTQQGPAEVDFNRMTDAEYVQWMRDHQPTEL